MKEREGGREGGRSENQGAKLLARSLKIAPDFTSLSPSLPSLLLFLPFYPPGPRRERSAAWRQSPSTRNYKSRCFPWRRSGENEERREGREGTRVRREVHVYGESRSGLPSSPFLHIQPRQKGEEGGKEGVTYLCPVLPVLRPPVRNRHAHPVKQGLRLDEGKECISSWTFLSMERWRVQDEGIVYIEKLPLPSVPPSFLFILPC